ncbi:hypothetical protein BDN70DRAFT_878464 [Pholiota conissans]|uniref:Lipid droplet-associated hydrolase n=1 Tax=Pholiota conissans TaxID=109636 RepID=A0A9P5Z2L9_9AGAR|nr:hypothetical protein BDN70DRAFT_878464 [Pholiota conissans]
MSLPSFLSPLTRSANSAPGLTSHNAQFAHNGSLGSSHVLWWPTLSGKDPDALLFFIPGNPGLVDFYIPFLSAIHAQELSPNLAIVAKAHVGHYPGVTETAPMHRPEESLTIQIQASLELLGTVINFYKRKPRIIVIGHSVGSWISLQLLKAVPHEISATFLLFPTISNIADTPNGKLLFPIFHPLSRSILSSLSVVAKWIPHRFISFLYASWPQNQVQVLREFISSGRSITASLSMAHQEMKNIRALDTALLEGCKDKLYFYYAESDNWVGKEREALLQVIGPNNESAKIVYEQSGIPHAFCINHSDLVAKDCSSWINRILHETI